METKVSRIEKEHVGKECCVVHAYWRTITAVGDDFFLASDENGENCFMRNSPWIIRDPEPVEKKPSIKLQEKTAGKLVDLDNLNQADIVILNFRFKKLLEVLDEQWEKTNSKTEGKIGEK